MCKLNRFYTPTQATCTSDHYHQTSKGKVWEEGCQHWHRAWSKAHWSQWEASHWFPRALAHTPTTTTTTWHSACVIRLGIGNPHKQKGVRNFSHTSPTCGAASQECPQTILSPMQGEEVPWGIQSSRHSGPIFSCSQDLPGCCYTGSLHNVGLYTMLGSDTVGTLSYTVGTPLYG